MKVEDFTVPFLERGVLPRWPRILLQGEPVSSPLPLSHLCGMCEGRPACVLDALGFNPVLLDMIAQVVAALAIGELFLLTLTSL